MLSSFYHPQNLYVFTYDTKSKKTFIKFIRKLAKCFQNVLIAKDNYLINWCDYGVLQATMSVLRTLTAQKSHRWKYFQYLSGTDLPLRTNLEMVQIFKVEVRCICCLLLLLAILENISTKNRRKCQYFFAN